MAPTAPLLNHLRAWERPPVQEPGSAARAEGSGGEAVLQGGSKRPPLSGCPWLWQSGGWAELREQVQLACGPGAALSLGPLAVEQG